MNLRYVVLDENLLTRGSDGTYYRLPYRPDGEKRRNKMYSKEIRPLNLSKCWELVNRCDTHEKIRCAEKWLEKANITVSEYDELMEALSYISRELYNLRWN